MFVPRLLHTSNIAFKNAAPYVLFVPPCCEILATGLVYTKSKQSCLCNAVLTL